MNLEDEIVILIDKIILLMKFQIKNSEHQSFGSLKPHLNSLIQAKRQKKYLDPLYYIMMPRWLGEFGNTELEREIHDVYVDITLKMTELRDGMDIVSTAINEHN